MTGWASMTQCAPETSCISMTRRASMIRRGSMTRCAGLLLAVGLLGAALRAWAQPTAAAPGPKDLRVSISGAPSASGEPGMAPPGQYKEMLFQYLLGQVDAEIGRASCRERV